jgi:hypothetical protein
MCKLTKINITGNICAHFLITLFLSWLWLEIFLPEICQGLELRQIQNNSLKETGIVIPDDSIKVFVYAGEPHGIKVNDDTIAVDYGRCGIIYDRNKGLRSAIYDISDGWPGNRPKEFPQVNPSRINGGLIGPGILDRQQSSAPIACSIEFQGSKWAAFQPAEFLVTIEKEGYKNRTGPYSTWSGVLKRLNEESYIQADMSGQESKRYTMSDGLASNIVTRLVASHGFLWASCVDIYQPDKKNWGPGGLSRFDPKTNRWEHIKTIEGHPVRWITLMETAGDDLWIGFREGNGVDGDKINYGMGVSVDIYRPKASSILLARFSKGKWTVFSEPLSFAEGISDTKDSPTQMPLRLAISNEQAFLFCGFRSRMPSYNYEYELNGYVSSLDLKSGKWRTFDLSKDFDADRLVDMYSEKNEVLIKINRGVHRWDNNSQDWKYLDPQTPLKNPSLSTAALRNDELWIGYTNQSFGVIGQQGISVFDENKLNWSYISPEQIGTGCPVWRMSTMTNGDIWILFSGRPWRGAALEFSLYSREGANNTKSGLGCFSNDKWNFPIDLQDIERNNNISLIFWDDGNYDLVAVGNKLFISNRKGVYVGPDKWQRIVEGDILRMDLSADGKSLIILRQGPRTDDNSSTYQRGRYHLTMGKISFESLPFEGLDRMQLEPPSYLWERNNETPEMWKQSWVLLPEFKEERWVVGPFGSNNGYHGVIETPYTFWIASQGELVRLERKSIENIVKTQ